MEIKEIHTEVNKTLAELLRIMSAIDEEQINTVPFEHSWTAGQLAQHLVMANSGFVEMLNGPVTPTEREPDALAANIKELFLDFTTKMKSPDFILPPDKNYNKEDLINSLKDIKEALNKTETLDLTKTCSSFELPVYGFLTRYEAICFVTYHTQRHIHQLKNIYIKLVN